MRSASSRFCVVPWTSSFLVMRWLCVALLGCFALGRSHAASVTWTGLAGDGAWSTPGNWSSGTLPTVADDVTLPSGLAGAVELRADVSIRSLRNAAKLRLVAGTESQAILRIAADSENTGTIELSSSRGDRTTQLVLTAPAVCSNRTAGVIRALAGAGGTRVLSGNIWNEGTLSVESGILLTVANTGATFRQISGQIDVAGSFVAQGGRFEHLGGALHGDCTAENAEVWVGPGIPVASTLFVRGSGAFLAGALSPLVTLHLTTSAEHQALLTTRPGATNRGRILLGSNRGDRFARIEAAEGLVNEPGAVIEARAEQGGSRGLAGRLVQRGTLRATNGMPLTVTGEFEMAGGVDEGEVNLLNATVRVTASPAVPTTLRLLGASSRLATDNLPQVTLQVISELEANARLELLGTITNHGTIELTTTRGDRTVFLAVDPAGELVNAPDGTLRGVVAFSTEREILGRVRNLGRIAVDLGASLRVRNSGTTFTMAGGKVEALGVMTVENGAFVFSGGVLDGTFATVNASHRVDPSVTEPSTVFVYGVESRLEGLRSRWVTLQLESNVEHHTALTAQPGCVNEGRLILGSSRGDRIVRLEAPAGLLNAASGIIQVVREQGGTRALNGVVRNAGLIVAPADWALPVTGEFELAGGRNSGPVNLVNVALRETAAPAAGTELRLFGGQSRLLTDNLPGVTLVVISDVEAQARLSLAADVVNRGTIRLASERGDRTTTLSTSPPLAPFVNAAGATLDIDPTNGGSRVLEAVLVNEGRVQVRHSLNVTAAGAHMNRGRLELLAGSLAFTAAGSTFQNETVGWLVGAATLDVRNADFRNAGHLAPGTSPGALKILGNYRQAPTAEVEIEIGGTTAGTQHDQLQLPAGAATLEGGTLQIQLLNGFVPVAGQEIIVGTSSGAGSGQFANYVGLAVTTNLSWQPVYAPTTTRLRAVVATNPPVAPTIARGPSDQSVAVGGTAQFTVTANGTAPFSYQWLFNNAPIDGATLPSLTLTQVRADQAGSYRVRISNAGGSVTSDPAALNVGEGTVFQWVGVGDGVNWTDVRNWNVDRLPGANDRVIVALPATAKIRLALAEVEVGRLECGAGLELVDGSLTVTSGESTVAGNVILTRSTLRVRGVGARLVGSSSGVAFASNLLAESGGRLALPGLTLYDGGSEARHLRLQAVGAGSVLDLAGLVTFRGITAGFSSIEVNASAGGTVGLDGVENLVEGGAASFRAFGANSRLDLSSLKTARGVTLEAREGGEVLTPNLAEARSTTLIRRDTGVLDVSGIATLVDAQLFVSGGASLAFPLVTTWETGPDNGQWVVEATGAGSEIDLSAVTRLEGPTAAFSALEIRALGGATIWLSGITQFDAGFVRFIGRDAGSNVDLSALVSIEGGELRAENNGAVNCPELAEVTNTALVRSGADSVLSTLRLAHLNRSWLSATAGAVMEFPALPTCEIGATPGQWTFEAVGAGSELRFPNLERLTGAEAPFSTLEVRARDGGAIRLPRPTAFDTGFARFRSDGPGSVVDLPRLRRIQGWEVILTGGGRLIAPDLAEMTKAALSVSGAASQFPTAALTRWIASSASVSGGARLGFPVLTVLEVGAGSGSWLMEVVDAGSVLEFPALTRVVGALVGFSALELRAVLGGEMSLPLVPAIREGFGRVTADAGGVLIWPQLRSVIGWEFSALNGGRIECPNLEEAVRSSLRVAGAASQLSAERLVVADGSSLEVSGGKVFRLPNLRHYDAGISAGSPLWQVSGSGSVLELPALVDLRGTGLAFTSLGILARAGGVVRLVEVPALEAGNFTVLAENGSRVDLSSITRAAHLSLQIHSGGRVDFPQLTEVSTADLQLSGTFTAPLAQLTSLRDSRVLVSPQTTVALAGLTDARGTRFETSGNGQVVLPPAADLQVTDIVAPTAGLAGAPVTVIWEVRNASSNPVTGMRRDALALRREGVPEVAFGTVEVEGTLAAGASRRYTNSIILPAGLTGVWRFAVTVDAGFEVFEGANESNNTTVDDAPIGLSSPDLIVATLTSTTVAPVAGQPFEVTWSVMNQGTTNAAGNWVDRVLLSTNATDFTGAVALGDFARPITLTPATTYTNRQSVAVPLSAALSPGAYFIAVQVDASDAQFEAQEANNTRTAAVTLAWPPLPNLLAQPVSSPAVAAPGELVRVVYQVRNDGSVRADGPWEETITLMRPEPGGAVPLEIARFVNAGPLGASSNQSMTREFRLPAGFGLGEWVMQVRVDAGDSVLESDESNTANFSTRLTVPAALTLDLPQTSLREDAVPPVVLARVRRNGDATTPLVVRLASSLPTRVLVPAEVTIPAGQEGVNLPVTVVRDGLATGDTAAVLRATAVGHREGTANLTVIDVDPAVLTLNFAAATVAEGATLMARVVRNGQLNQPLTVNFASDSPNRLLPPAALVIPAGQTNGTALFVALDDDLIAPLQSFRVTASAPGFVTTDAVVQVTDNDLPILGLSLTPGTISEGDRAPAAMGSVERFGPTRAPLLVRLTSSNTNAAVVPFSVLIPAGEATATFAVTAVDDALIDGEQTTEISAQATYSATGEPAGLPESRVLRVTDDEGPTLKVTLARRLVGEGLSPATTATVLNDSSQSVVATLATSDAGEAFWVRATVTLAAGASTNVPVHSLDDGVVDGSQTVVLTASAPGFVTGRDTLVVSDRVDPDLIVEEVNAPAQGVTKALAALGWKVRNQGLATAKGKFRQTVHLSSDDRLDADDPLVADQELDGELPAGQSFSFVRTIFLPSEPGDYWVFVRTDAGDAFAETLEDNNLAVASQPIHVRPAYFAEAITVNPTVGSIGQPVTISGRLRRTDTQALAPFEIAAVQVTSDDGSGPVVRTLAGLSGENGEFTATFRPGAREAGVFGVGAGHPAEGALPVRTTFRLVGFAPTNAEPVVLESAAGLVLNGELSVTGLGGVALTAVSAAWVDLPPGLTGTATAQAPVLPPGVAGTVRYALTLGSNVVGRFNLSLRLTSAEGARRDIPIVLQARPVLPRLVVTPERLLAGMVRGRQTTVTLAVTNEGAVASGPVALALPEAPWLASATRLPLPSLGVGEGTTVRLILTPSADLPLQSYRGELGVLAGAATTRVPFEFRAVSEAVGDLSVVAEDEYTYYAAGAPRVAGARVQLLDAYDHARIIREGSTDAAGRASLAGVPEGPYLLRVTAPKHTSQERRVEVRPGFLSEVRVLLPTETVSYSWNVVPTEVPDRYQITLESTFETNVPFPVVTALEPVVFPVVYPGEVTQIAITYTNHGLIAAKGLKLRPRSTGTYLITPLFTELGDLPAKSSITVPVFVQLQPDVDARMIARLKEIGRWPPPGAARQLGGGAARPASALTGLGRIGVPGLAAGGSDDCETPELEVLYFVICGPDGILHSVAVDLKPFMMLKDAYGCAKALAELVKGLAGVPGAICDCASSVAAAMGGSVPKSLECLCAFLSLDAAGIAKCICPKIEGDGGGVVTGDAGAFQITGIPPGGGGGGDCTPFGGGGGGAGGGGGGARSLALRPTAGGFTVATRAELLSLQSRASSPVAALRHAAPAGREPAPQPVETQVGDGICATVKLRIEQDLVLTRAAFRGTLRLENRLPSALEAVGFQLDFRDAGGRRVNELFGVRPAVLTGLTAVDGTGTLPGNTAGNVEFTLVPSVDAAPEGETPYTVGGELRYRDGATEVVIELQPVPIRVLPQPRLVVDYFHQRDVRSDDPHTPEIEPAEPYTLAVRLRNEGLGSARHVTLTSAQPTIVENEKGLLIDFQIVGTELYSRDGLQDLVPSLTANFGDLSPGETRIGRWLLKSTLQGFFKDYTASFEHLDGLGQANLSLIDPAGVRIHELTRLVRDPRPTADALPDFLVNDDFATDPEDVPESLYLSNGAVEPVRVVRTLSVGATVAPDRLRVDIEFSGAPGWTYLRVPDPQGAAGDRQYRLVRVFRSDGPSLPADNFWQTDRTFVGLGRPPVKENRLHLFDAESTGRYTLVYEPVAPADTIAPTSAVAALPSQMFDQFTVQWDGADETGGDLVFDVYVSRDDGAFTPWLHRTPLKAALFPGEHGHRYAFYSVAIDLAGNVETAPATPDASTRTVLENTAPGLAAIPDQVIDEGQEFRLDLVAADPDVPAQTLTFALAQGAPAGLTIDAATGQLRWATGEGNGPAVYPVSVFVRDNGTPVLTASRSFTLTVREVNQAPIIDPIANRSVKEGSLLTFIVPARDADLPAQTLTYALAPGAPEGASIAATSGIFNWRPREFQGPSTNRLTIIVKDAGDPPLSATRDFEVIVRDALGDFRLTVGSTNVTAGQSQAVPIRLATGTPMVDLEFVLEARGESLRDLRLEPGTAPLDGLVFQGLEGGRYLATLFAPAGGAFEGDLDLGRLRFASTGGRSEVATLLPSSITATGGDGVTVLRGAGQGGRVFVVERQPLLDFIGKSAVVLHGIPGRVYAVEVSTDSDAGRVWVEVDRQVLGGPTFLVNLPISEANRWVRLREIP